MMDILTIVDTYYDDSIGYYVNGDKKADVHCNDAHEIPDVLISLILRYDIKKVEKAKLSEVGHQIYEAHDYFHPQKLSDYPEGSFEEVDTEEAE